MVVPAPFLLRWAHFEILRAGCPSCGGRSLEFLKGEMGPPELSAEISDTSGEIPILPIRWEDISYRCKKCQRNFTYRFLSPRAPQQTYEELARAHLRDLIAFFAGEMAESEIIPNYVEFGYWLGALFKAAAFEEKAKNIPLTKWLLEEIQHLAAELSHKFNKSALQASNFSILKQAKLLVFTTNEVLPRIFTQ